MNHDINLDIVVPTYNGANHLPRLLASIEKQSYSNYKCFVIDDCSTDETVKLVREQFPWVHLITQPENYGPAINRNVAVDAGNNPYVVIFDDDTYLEDRDWLAKGLQYMEENPAVGQLGAMIISGFAPDILLDCGILQNRYLFGGIFHNQDSRQVQGKHLNERRILGACSAGTILRRDLLEMIGGFDGKYFYPVEDLDVSLRVHLAGYDVRYEPSLVVFHYESQAMGKSLSRKMYMYRRNCLLALVENFPFSHISMILMAVMIKEVVLPSVRYGIRVITRNQTEPLADSVGDYLKTFLFLLKNSGAIVKKRLFVSRFRKRPRSYLLKVNKELAQDLLI